MPAILCRPAGPGCPQATEEKHFTWHLDGRKRRKSLTGTWQCMRIRNVGDGDCMLWFGKSVPAVLLPAKNTFNLDSGLVRHLVFKCRAGIKTTVDCKVSRVARAGRRP